VSTDSDRVKQLDAELARAGLARWTPVPPLRMSNLEHVARVQPFAWRWRELEPLLGKVSELSTDIARTGQAKPRRVVRLVNPSTNAQWPSVTSTLGCNITLLLPGERWHAHRHVAEAIRFMLRGRGEFVVGSERCVMGPGDLAITPSLVNHEHSNVGYDAPATWIDGLNVGIVRALECPFYEEFPGETLAVTETAEPRMHFPWERTYAALRALVERGELSPFDDALLEYTQPLKTIGCFIQLLRPGIRTRSHRQTSSAIYHVFRGSGSSVVGNGRIEWSAGDFFVVPPWTFHEHANASASDEAILFSMQDTPVYKALGLYHEEAHPKHHVEPDGSVRPSSLSDVWSR
jgi:gentisate 1,2-dioxygenase